MRKALIGIIGSMMLAGSAMAQTANDYAFDNAQELLALCSTNKSSPNYNAAISFCYGYGHGAYQYYVAQSTGEGGSKFVCAPKDLSRAKAWTEFLAWLKKNPQYQGGEAVDVLFRYLGTTYPC